MNETKEEIAKQVAGLMELNAIELAAATIDALKAPDSLRFAGGLGIMMRRNPAETVSVLLNLIIDYLELWGDDELPLTDELRNTTLPSVVRHIEDKNLAGIYQLADNDPSATIQMLVATAATLKR